MFKTFTKGMSTAMTTAVLAASLLGVGAVTQPAAAACSGENSRNVVVVDPATGGETTDVKIDSCKTQELIDAYGKVKDGAGLTGLLGAKWWPAGVTAGVFFGWAWLNQDTLKDCASKGTGVKFTEINGIVTGCSAQ